ncbi:MAG: amino acid racemase [Kosmotogaceae bacterium]
MKTIGIIGGMSPESTIEYYRYIVHRYVSNYGDSSYPKIIIHSVSFQQFINWMNTNNTEAIEESLLIAAQSLESAGADFLIVATNTMHLYVDRIREECNLYFLEITEVVKQLILNKNYKKVGVIGTKTCMEKGLYQKALEESGIEVIVPSEKERSFINSVIFNELTKGIFLPKRKKQFENIINSLKERGARAVIMGCTEIPLLMRDHNMDIDLIDTTSLHAQKALEYAIKE